MKKYTAIILMVVLLLAAVSPALARETQKYTSEERSGYAFWYEGEWGDAEVYMTYLSVYQTDQKTAFLYVYQEKGTWTPYSEPICEEYCEDDECFIWCQEGEYEWETVLDLVYEIPASDFSIAPNFKDASLHTETLSGFISVIWEPTAFQTYASKGTDTFYNYFKATHKAKDKSAHGMVWGSIIGDELGYGYGGVGNYSSIYHIKVGSPEARFKAAKSYTPAKTSRYQERMGYASWYEGSWGEGDLTYTDIWLNQAGKDSVYLHLYREKGTWAPYDEPICYTDCYEDECYEWCEYGEYEWEYVMDASYLIPVSSFSTSANFKKGALLQAEVEEGTIRVVWEPKFYSTYKNRGSFSVDHFKITYKSNSIYADGYVYGWIFGEEMGQGYGGIGGSSWVERINEGNGKKF